ncbi:hypothetical protein MAR_023783 [Mya arenaria]|uniref:Uncharacterized protein n=1 Tax=Mya arenaria TaxID=6604 RepID=A0ABY7DWU5_MYAAR|nr:hypothetical protein MAR_023783 [Mya arenaria]
MSSGLGGTLWFSIGIIVDILLFPFLIHFLKTRAPGAKIFPQIAYARFGVTGHVMFCILAMTSSWHKHAARWKECSCVSTNDINNEFIFLVLTPSYSGHFVRLADSERHQANWQSRIAAKPSKGVLGFFMAAYLWFVIAPCPSVTATITYFAMS